MKEQEEEKKFYLTLSLPFVEIDNNNEYESDNYKENGCFFVKTKDSGLFIVEVDKDSGEVRSHILPGIAIHYVMQEVGISSAKKLIEERLQRLEEIVNSLDQNTIHWHNSVSDKINSNTGFIRDIQQDFIKRLSEQQNQTEEKGKGYISQEALVEIIRTIK